MVVEKPQEQWTSTDNLTPWKPGESGNPKGRPKNSVTAMLKETTPETSKKIAKKLTDLAVEGDLKAIDMFIDRTDGPVNKESQGNTYNDIKVLIVREKPKEIEDATE